MHQQDILSEVDRVQQVLEFRGTHRGEASITEHTAPINRVEGIDRRHVHDSKEHEKTSQRGLQVGKKREGTGSCIT